MRAILVAAVLTGLSGAAVAGEGIRWEPNVAGGLARAAREGRPVLLAVNALEGEGANEHLCHRVYPSSPWGRATRDYVCLVCNAGTHPSGGDTASCGRYEGIPCRSHQDAWRYAVGRFSPVEHTLISPQHVILEPDGGVTWRKEYYTGVVGPELLDRYFVHVSPELACERVGDVAAARIESLEQAPVPVAVEQARAWLRSGDVYAAAGVIRAIDFARDEGRRRGLTQALDAATADHLPVLKLLADDHGARPDDRPEEALALARTLLVLERSAGIRLLARIACHTRDPARREQVFELWRAGANSGALPPEEPHLLREARLLSLGAAGDRPTPARPPPALRARLERAEAVAGLRPRRFPPLEEALAQGTNGEVRGALLEATPEDVRKHAAAVKALLVARPPVVRLRVAAAVALLGARVEAPGQVAAYVWRGVEDPLEGEEIRVAAVARLGFDPGWGAEAWLGEVAKAVKEGR